jgi:predicted transcriptional regulator
MRLTHLAIIAIKGCDGIVGKLADSLQVEPVTIYKYIRENSTNLTKAAALEVIRKETGLSDDQILEKEPAVA